MPEANGPDSPTAAMPPLGPAPDLEERDRRRREVLAAVLPHIPFDGWTEAALGAAARDLDCSPAELRRVFPGGVPDVIAFWVAEADRQMLQELEALDLPSMRIRERIATAVRVRLESHTADKEAVRRALGRQAAPDQALHSVLGLYRTVDAMWYAAGDTATDWNFYTKRALLAGVYASTLLYWLQDQSEGSAATWSFLDRRIDDVMRIQKLRGRLDKVADRLPNPFRLLRPFQPGGAGMYPSAGPYPQPGSYPGEPTAGR